jgi:hypothetical protein
MTNPSQGDDAKLAERIAELLEWSSTGSLPAQSKFREYAESLTEIPERMRMAVAERNIESQAMVFALAALRHPHQPQGGVPSEQWTRVSDCHPQPHASYLVRRNKTISTATPCYGMHHPWWVFRDPTGKTFELDPVSMADDDEWRSLDAAALTPLPAGGLTGEETAWACFNEHGQVLVRTISDTRRAAIVNWIVTERSIFIGANYTDEQIERSWQCLKGLCEVRRVVIIDRLTKSQSRDDAAAQRSPMKKGE